MDGRRQCTGKSKQSGERCKRRPIPGGFVCVMHGGKIPKVQAKAAERMADLIDPDRAIREAARLAYSDVRDLYDDKGNLLPIKQWPDHIAAAVGGFEVVRGNVDKGDGQFDAVIKPRLWDKPKNLELMFKYLKLIGPDVLNVNINLEQQIREARKRVPVS